MGRRQARRLVLAIGTGVIVLGVASGPSAAAPVSGGGSPPTPTSETVVADQDGDGIADDLQDRLATAAPRERVDVIATFHDRAGVAAARRGLRAGEMRRPFDIVPGFAATMSVARARVLARDPALRRLEHDGTSHAAMEAARADFGVDLARERFGADGAGIGVCVVDTGVDPNHEQFDSKLPIPFFDAIDGRTTVYDDQGHGTHVASIAVGDGTGGSLAGRLAGVAPAAGLAVAKVLGSDGSGPNSGVIAGIEWCAARDDVHVINLSIGDPGVVSDGSDAVSQAVAAAVTEHGKVVVAAAGNSGDLPQTINPPGVAPLAVTVGAVAEWSAPDTVPWASHGIFLAPFSSRGPTVDGRTKPDVVAPGHSVAAAARGTTASYETKSGTSMATPFVAGAAALVLTERPDLSPARVKLLVEATARDRGGPGKDDEWGAGLLDVHRLVNTVADIRDFDPGHLFPWEEHVELEVADGVTSVHTFDVAEDALGAPIGLTAILGGAPVCTFPWIDSCLAWEWSPDLDLELRDPLGSLVATSSCAAGSAQGCGTGRQETIGHTPTVAGTYRLDVIPYSGSPNDGAGGPVSISIQRGPMRHPDLPVLHRRDEPDAGPVWVSRLDGRVVSEARTWTAEVTVHLDRDRAAFGGDAIVTGTWDHDDQTGWCLAQAGRCTITRAGVDSSVRAMTFTVDDVAATADGRLVPFADDGPSTATLQR